jgi:hypothetical protein
MRLFTGSLPRLLGFDPMSCGISNGQNSTGVGFLRVLRFPLPIIPPDAPYAPVIQGWYRQANVPPYET